jgi:hypothetical protein
MHAHDVVSVAAGGQMDAVLHIRLPRREKLQLRNYAIQNGLSISELVREWIAPELQKLIASDA